MLKSKAPQEVEEVLGMHEATLDMDSQGEEIKLAAEFTSPTVKKMECQRNKRCM